MYLPTGGNRRYRNHLMVDFIPVRVLERSPRDRLVEALTILGTCLSVALAIAMAVMCL